MSSTVRTAIVGASGYALAELVRLLAGHPQIEIGALSARGGDGSPLADEFPHLAPLGLRPVDGGPEPGIDVAFLALPSGALVELTVRLAEAGTTVVDIGSDRGPFPAAATFTGLPGRRQTRRRRDRHAGPLPVDRLTSLTHDGRGLLPRPPWVSINDGPVP